MRISMDMDGNRSTFETKEYGWSVPFELTVAPLGTWKHKKVSSRPTMTTPTTPNRPPRTKRPPLHIETLSNGLGAPSMWLIELAGEEKIPARLSITADTGWEQDRLLSDGSRVTNQQYFDQIVKPRCQMYGIEAVFVRAQDKNGNPMPGLGEWMESYINAGKLTSLKIPMYGSRNGQLHQSCTDRMKVKAIQQELRRRGATTARTALALTISEVHRMKGRNGRYQDGFYTLTSMHNTWQAHYYPLIDLRITRAEIKKLLTDRGIPYLLSSECDGCPHQDWPRWSRHTPETIAYLAEMERKCNGAFFFTDRRIPLKEALEEMRKAWEAKHTGTLPLPLDEADFGCDAGGYCGV